MTEPAAPSPSPQRKPNPVITGSPPERYAQIAAWRLREREKEKSRIVARGAERLVAAEDRYNAFRAQQQADRDKRADLLQKDISNAQQHLWKSQRTATALLDRLESERAENEAHEAESNALRQKTHQHVLQVREQAAQHSDQISDKMTQLMSNAEDAVQGHHANASSDLAEHKKHREARELEALANVAAHSDQTSQFVDQVLSKTTAGILEMENHRHHASTYIDRAGGLAQATRTQAQLTMRLHGEKSKQQADELTNLTHQTRLRTDKALAEKLTSTSSSLAAAKDYCQKLRSDLAEETARVKLAAAEVQLEQENSTREEARKLRHLEDTFLDGFDSGMKVVNEAQEQMNASRQSLQAEMSDIDKRLQEIQEETQDRLQAILSQWARDRAEADEACAEWEKKGKAALKDLKAIMSRTTSVTEDKEHKVREACASTVSELERQAELDAERAVNSAEASKRADDRATAAALAELKGLKEQASVVEAEADKQIEASMAKALEMERQLEKEAEAQTSLAKQLIKKAHEEEKILIADTSAAWERIRKASYKLRLANLHDFAQGVVSGDFDRKG